MKRGIDMFKREKHYCKDCSFYSNWKCQHPKRAKVITNYIMGYDTTIHFSCGNYNSDGKCRLFMRCFK